MKRSLKTLLNRVMACTIGLTLLTTQTILPAPVQAQELLNLPAPGSMVGLSPQFVPPILKGLKLFPDNPLRFDFVIDTGSAPVTDERLSTESNKLIKYFLAALTMPEDDLWVNLSPYEANRIIPDEFGRTEMGRDLLAQDYVLKQITSSLLHPDKELGQAFWSTVQPRLLEEYGTIDIPINTFNKVWIIPDEAVVYENRDTAFVIKSHLKVMLESDYLALQNNANTNGPVGSALDQAAAKTINDISSAAVREVILPALEQEINEGDNFAPLRQIYHSLILATWFKQNLKNSLLGQVYSEKKKTAGVEVDDRQINEKIYQRYLKAFEVGVYNFIREDVDPLTQQLIPRKYFSGGTRLDLKEKLSVEKPGDAGTRIAVKQTTKGALHAASAFLAPHKKEKPEDPDILSQALRYPPGVFLDIRELATDQIPVEQVRQILTQASYLEQEGNEFLMTRPRGLSAAGVGEDPDESAVPDKPEPQSESDVANRSGEAQGKHARQINKMLNLSQFDTDEAQNWETAQAQWQIDRLEYSPGGIQNSGLTDDEGNEVKADEFKDHPNWIYVLKNTWTDRTVYAGPNDVKMFEDFQEKKERIAALRTAKQDDIKSYGQKLALLREAARLFIDSTTDLSPDLNSLTADTIGDRHFSLIEKAYAQMESSWQRQNDTDLSLLRFSEIYADLAKALPVFSSKRKLSFIASEERQHVIAALTEINQGIPLNPETTATLVNAHAKIMAFKTQNRQEALGWGRRTAQTADDRHEAQRPAFHASLWTANYLRKTFAAKAPDILDIGAGLSVLWQKLRSTQADGDVDLAGGVVELELHEDTYTHAPNPLRVRADISQLHEEGGLEGLPIIQDSADPTAELLLTSQNNFEVVTANFVFDQLNPAQLKNTLIALENLLESDGQLIITLPEHSPLQNSEFDQVLQELGYTVVAQQANVKNQLTKAAEQRIREQEGPERLRQIKAGLDKVFHAGVYEKTTTVARADIEAIDGKRLRIRRPRKKTEDPTGESNPFFTRFDPDDLYNLDIHAGLTAEDFETRDLEAIVTRDELDQDDTFNQHLTALAQAADQLPNNVKVALPNGMGPALARAAELQDVWHTDDTPAFLTRDEVNKINAAATRPVLTLEQLKPHFLQAVETFAQQQTRARERKQLELTAEAGDGYYDALAAFDREQAKKRYSLAAIHRIESPPQTTSELSKQVDPKNAPISTILPEKFGPESREIQSLQKNGIKTVADWIWASDAQLVFISYLPKTLVARIDQALATQFQTRRPLKFSPTKHSLYKELEPPFKNYTKGPSLLDKLFNERKKYIDPALHKVKKSSHTGYTYRLGLTQFLEHGALDLISTVVSARDSSTDRFQKSYHAFQREHVNRIILDKFSPDQSLDAQTFIDIGIAANEAEVEALLENSAVATRTFDRTWVRASRSKSPKINEEVTGQVSARVNELLDHEPVIVEHWAAELNLHPSDVRELLTASPHNIDPQRVMSWEEWLPRLTTEASGPHDLSEAEMPPGILAKFPAENLGSSVDNKSPYFIDFPRLTESGSDEEEARFTEKSFREARAALTSETEGQPSIRQLADHLDWSLQEIWYRKVRFISQADWDSDLDIKMDYAELPPDQQRLSALGVSQALNENDIESTHNRVAKLLATKPTIINGLKSRFPDETWTSWGMQESEPKADITWLIANIPGAVEAVKAAGISPTFNQVYKQLGLGGMAVLTKVFESRPDLKPEDFGLLPRKTKAQLNAELAEKERAEFPQKKRDIVTAIHRLRDEQKIVSVETIASVLGYQDIKTFRNWLERNASGKDITTWDYEIEPILEAARAKSKSPGEFFDALDLASELNLAFERLEEILKDNGFIEHATEPFLMTRSRGIGADAVKGGDPDRKYTFTTAAESPVADSAGPDSTDALGGVNFNPKLIKLQAIGEGIDLNLPDAFPANIQEWDIDGFAPVIFNIAPVTNLPLLLGMSEEPAGTGSETSLATTSSPPQLSVLPDRGSVLTKLSQRQARPE